METGVKTVRLSDKGVRIHLNHIRFWDSILHDIVVAHIEKIECEGKIVSLIVRRCYEDPIGYTIEYDLMLLNKKIGEAEHCTINLEKSYDDYIIIKSLEKPIRIYIKRSGKWNIPDDEIGLKQVYGEYTEIYEVVPT